jgi:hypothetical protein
MNFIKIFIFLSLVLPLRGNSREETIVRGAPIKAAHLNELMNEINTKRSCLGLSPVIWTVPVIISGQTPIRLSHFNEIKNAIQDTKSSCFTGGGSCPGENSFSPVGFSTGINFRDTTVINADDVSKLAKNLNLIKCTVYTYAWVPSDWGACTGGTGSWSYGNWGSCIGGSKDFSFSSWGACSNSCGGGIKNREALCVNKINGVSSRTSQCIFNNNSGVLTRSLKCQRSDSLVVADSFCTDPRPEISSACTPTDPSVCGVRALVSEACPSTSPCHGSPITSKVCNPHSCEKEVTCWSRDYRPENCDTGVAIKSVTIIRKVSKSGCGGRVTFSGTVLTVVGGCRADFLVKY